MMRENTERAFFALVRAGLWGESDANLNLNDNHFEDVEWEKIYQLAQEQSVVGLVLAGLEQYKNLNVNLNVNQKLLLQWIGEVQLIEQRNKAMNRFVAELIGKMRKAGIYALLMKGQGVAQCYEKPLWRASGDVDLLLSDDNYDKAKQFLGSMASTVETEGLREKHLGMTIDGWTVELHGTLRGGLSNRVDKVLDEVQNDVFHGGNVRSWMDGRTQVFLPAANEDIVYVFAHILQHFYKVGIGLRQICDWCRLMWTYRDTLDLELQEKRIRKAGLLDEWKTFGAFAVKYLGMPIEAMPLYGSSKVLGQAKRRSRAQKVLGQAKRQSRAQNFNKKADRICKFILEVGNFGHNRDTSYYGKYPFLIRKTISFGRRLKDLVRHARIFPMDSVRFLFGMTFSGLNAAAHGE